MNLPILPNEEERLRALSEFDILDTESESAFDDLAQLAATICGTPVAAISLVDRSRIWFKAMFGASITEVPRLDTLCTHAVLEPDELLVVEDTTVETRFPDYKPENFPDVVFYAGAPLVTKEGFALGSLCVTAPHQRSLTEDQRIALRALASQVLAQLELRQTVRDLKKRSEELAKALERAESSSLAKNAFLANMSHEVRTPLNGVIGMAEILASTPLSERQRRYVDAIRRSGEGLLGMLNDVLEVVQSEGSEPRVGEVAIASLLDELVGMMQPAAESKRLWIDLQVDTALNMSFRTDPLRLRQIVTSLLANAVRFTEKGWIQVRADLVGSESDRRQVRFEIQDSGMGISPELCEDILRSDDAETGPGRRSGGLGLALCRRLLASMGGELSLTSEVGLGSTFSFTLDLEPVVTSASIRPKRVLVVEDNEVNSMVISAMLEQNGCQVVCVENGALAVELLSREHFDMVFMDLHMPEMDGVTATKRVREMEGVTVHTPIVAVTASAFTEEEARCKEAGMDGLIRKPINERLVREALSLYKARVA